MTSRPLLALSASFGLLLGCATATPAPQAAAAPTPARQPAQATVRLSAPAEHDYDAEFFPGTTYDAAIATPASLLGFEVGAQPASHEQVIRAWRTWAAQSKRVKLETYGHTHEGRELVHAVVTSEKNLAQLDSILERVGKLADPRKLGTGEAARIADSTPAVAWLGYSIHGDEMSGVDGALALAHHLIAGTSKDVTELLDSVVIVIDPMQNPDGRERFLSLLLHAAGATGVLDSDALSHGRWPNGRGNHYLFDMNRDWIGGVAPETRGRWRAVQRFHPQLFVDAHEMGRDEGYLFYPQADPINPHLPKQLVEWQVRYAADIAKSFDSHGWSYYTREWADGWGPFYTDSWASLNGAIGILYEQARYDGQTVELSSGEIATYRSAAHHQAEASLANLKTLAAARKEALEHYAEFRKLATFGDGSLERPWFVVRRGGHGERFERLLQLLHEQGIEFALVEGAKLGGALDSLGASADNVDAAGQCAVISALQPQGALVRAFLEFDTRYPKADLERERRSLELKNDSRIYDTTAWNLGQAFALECWWAKTVGNAGEMRLQPPPARAGRVESAKAKPYGWIVDGEDDAAVEFASRAMLAGAKVAIADEPFESAGRTFPRGSLLVRGHENAAEIESVLTRAAQDSGAVVIPTGSARAPGDGHDLGGQHFQLLERPRVALLSNAPVQNTSFGQLWHALDFELGLPVSLLDAQDLSSYDLRRYNVLVLPPGGGMASLLEPHAEALAAWIDGGGTLIACGSSAGALASEKLGLSGVRKREDVLTKLPEYLFAAQRERESRAITIDERAVWDGAQESAEPPETPKKDEPKPTEAAVDPDAEREDAWRRRFSPAGVILRAEVRDDHWLTFGAGAQLPVYFEGSLSLWARSPAVTAVRLAPAPSVRLSGLLWPESRARLADSAYLTVERRGFGQVILFAAQPGFRGFHRGTNRLFLNAVVYGPGLGAQPPKLR
ncbi:MAG: M14 family metallopeptidase [Planctomycetota bacterium]|nr:M14 family metallopeptidase [Planctomycetota bacterium]